MNTARRTRPLYTQDMIEAAMREYLSQRLPKAAPAPPVVRVGDRIAARPYANAYWDGCGRPPIVCGEIEYVHPEGRYALAAFRIGRTIIRECFSPTDMRIKRGDGD